MKEIRHALGDAIGRRLSLADMAKLVGLKDPEGNGRDTYRKWEEGHGPSGPVATLLLLYAAGINHDEVPGFFIAYIEARLDGEA
jgi:transcriptional regulator with XRE-family HTH domain